MISCLESNHGLLNNPRRIRLDVKGQLVYEVVIQQNVQVIYGNLLLLREVLVHPPQESFFFVGDLLRRNFAQVLDQFLKTVGFDVFVSILEGMDDSIHSIFEQTFGAH